MKTERYRSGHNGAVLKTVRVQAHVGSNPTLSAIKNLISFFLYIIRRSTQVGRRGAPAKGIGRVSGARVQIPPSPPLFTLYINIKNIQICYFKGFQAFFYLCKYLKYVFKYLKVRSKVRYFN